MGNTQKKLFLWAGIFSGVTATFNLVVFILLNFVFKSFYAELLTFMESDLGALSMFGSYKTYYNSLLIVSFAINLYLSFMYISYSRMSIRKLTQKSGGLFGLLLINAFCGGNIVALIIYGKSKGFGLLGREEDIRICWNEIWSGFKCLHKF